MRVSLVLPETNVVADLEQILFDFTNRLGRHCASIRSCELAIGAAEPSGFAVNMTLHVFGEDLRLAALASADRREEALSQALEDLFRQASARLESISRDHSGCGCRLEPAIRTAPPGKPT